MRLIKLIGKLIQVGLCWMGYHEPYTSYDANCFLMGLPSICKHCLRKKLTQ